MKKETKSNFISIVSNSSGVNLLRSPSLYMKPSLRLARPPSNGITKLVPALGVRARVILSLVSASNICLGTALPDSKFSCACQSVDPFFFLIHRKSPLFTKLPKLIEARPTPCHSTLLAASSPPSSLPNSSDCDCSYLPDSTVTTLGILRLTLARTSCCALSIVATG